MYKLLQQDRPLSAGAIRFWRKLVVGFAALAGLIWSVLSLRTLVICVTGKPAILRSKASLAPIRLTGRGAAWGNQ